jgi:hypothetical protein
MLDFEHKRHRGNSDNEPGKRPVKSPQDFQKKSGIYSKGFFNKGNNAAKSTAMKSSNRSRQKMHKVIVIGNQHVGKTSVINKYVRNIFQRYQAETQTHDF